METKEPEKKKEVIAKEENEEEKDKNLIIGRDFSGEVTQLCDITEYSGKVVVSGKIIGHERRETETIFFRYLSQMILHLSHVSVLLSLIRLKM